MRWFRPRSLDLLGELLLQRLEPAGGHRVRDNAGDVGHTVVAQVEQGAVVLRAPERAFEVIVLVSESLDLALQLLRPRLLDALPPRVSLVRIVGRLVAAFERGRMVEAGALVRPQRVAPRLDGRMSSSNPSDSRSAL